MTARRPAKMSAVGSSACHSGRVNTLQFISSLAWPAVAVGLAVMFRAQVRKALSNVADRMESFEGFGIKAKLRAINTVRSALEQALPSADPSGNVSFSGDVDTKLIPGAETLGQREEVQKVVELAARMGWTLASTGMLTTYKPPLVSWDDQGRPGIEIPVEPGDLFPNGPAAWTPNVVRRRMPAAFKPVRPFTAEPPRAQQVDDLAGAEASERHESDRPRDDNLAGQ